MKKNNISIFISFINIWMYSCFFVFIKIIYYYKLKEIVNYKTISYIKIISISKLFEVLSSVLWAMGAIYPAVSILQAYGSLYPIIMVVTIFILKHLFNICLNVENNIKNNNRIIAFVLISICSFYL